jgi:hypothetical protein
MTPEMIALLHLAQCAPYMVGAAKGATGNGLIASTAITLVSSFVPTPTSALARPMVGMLGGMVQTWAEQKMTNVVNQNRSTEVMVNALMAGIRQQGSFNDRAKAVTSYAIQRQALQDAGTLARDCFETNKAGAISRMWQDAKNSWQEMNWKAKAFTVVTTAALAVGTAATAAIAVLAIAGTGGGAIAVAALAGATVMPFGAYLARTAVNLIASTNFLGLKDAHERAKEKMTQQRIDEALNRLEDKMKGDQRLGDLLGGSLKDIGQLIQLSHLPQPQQKNSFANQVKAITSERRKEVIADSTRAKADLIKVAKDFVPESIISGHDGKVYWEDCYQQVEETLVAHVA